jgi:hypothetical protein
MDGIRKDGANVRNVIKKSWLMWRDPGRQAIKGGHRATGSDDDILFPFYFYF